MFSLAVRRALAPACYPYPGDGRDEDRGRETERRKGPPAAGLFGERSRADSLPFVKPPPVRKIGDRGGD